MFKGVTALRLAYGSPRFSEDLDFNLLEDSLKGEVESVAESMVEPYPEASLTDVAEKRWAYLWEIKVTEGYLPYPLRVMVEISRREAKEYDHRLRLITSPATPLQVLGKVATLEQLYKDKSDCVKDRAAPKDLFDLWYICQKLRIPYRPPETWVSGKGLRRDLGKYLPADFGTVIEELL